MTIDSRFLATSSPKITRMPQAASSAEQSGRDEKLVRFSDDIVVIGYGGRDDESASSASSVCLSSSPDGTVQDEGPYVSFEDLLDDYLDTCQQRLSADSTEGHALVDAMRDGNERAQTFVRNMAVVDSLVDALMKELARLKCDERITLEKARSLADDLATLWDQADALCKPLARVLDANSVGTDRGEARLSEPARHRSATSSRDEFERKGADVVRKFVGFGCELARLRGEGEADTHGGQHLFKLMVENVTIPGIAKRKGCAAAQVADRHLNTGLLDFFAQECREIGERLSPGAFETMAWDLGQALDLCRLPQRDANLTEPGYEPRACSDGDSLAGSDGTPGAALNSRLPVLNVTTEKKSVAVADPSPAAGQGINEMFAAWLRSLPPVRDQDGAQAWGASASSDTLSMASSSVTLDSLGTDGPEEEKSVASVELVQRNREIMAKVVNQNPARSPSALSGAQSQTQTGIAARVEPKARPDTNPVAEPTAYTGRKWNIPTPISGLARPVQPSAPKGVHRFVTGKP
ncbi:hypothetical protein MyNCGM683_06580 [Achromobacter xylosoxidans]